VEVRDGRRCANREGVVSSGRGRESAIAEDLERERSPRQGHDDLDELPRGLQRRGYAAARKKCEGGDQGERERDR
jgi:hypothetical protein